MWLDAWEMDCCGDPFAVGDTVEWTVASPDPAWLLRVYGEEAGGLTDVVDRHETRDACYELRGVVRRIRAGHVHLVPSSPGQGGRVLPAGGVLRDVRQATRFAPAPSGREHSGFLVDLEVTPPAGGSTG